MSAVIIIGQIAARKAVQRLYKTGGFENYSTTFKVKQKNQQCKNMGLSMKMSKKIRYKEVVDFNSQYKQMKSDNNLMK